MRSLWKKTTGSWSVPARSAALLRAVLALAGCVWFLWPAWQRTRPHAPFPLDDVYIHLDYARSFRLLEPFAWLPGQGYSSGETAPLYALVLGAFAQLGVDGDALGLVASALAVACVLAAVHLLGSLAPRGALLGVLAPLVFVGFGVITWSLLSGMELGLYFALFALLLQRAAGTHGARSLGALSLLLALLVAVRPEALLLSLVLAAGLARDRVAARPTRRIAAYLRLVLPAVLLQASVFAANRALTGEWQSAGAILKLVTENPALDDAARLREVLTNLVTAWFGAFSRSTVSPATCLALLLLLQVAALVPRRGRGLTWALIFAAPLLAVLVSLNATARYQGFRYYVPALLCVLALAARGLYAIGRHAPRAASALAALLLALTVPKLPIHRTHFERAAANIAEQQVEVGLRLARDTSPSARVLLGDAGAIAYFSGRSAIDALGLGGFRGRPFVRAATHGEAATLELIERLDPAERPTHLALYASWFPAIVRGFGREWFSVTLDDNVICGAPTKTVYHANWSALGEHVPERLVPIGTPARLLDQVDFADLESEREHAFAGSRFFATAAEIREEDQAQRFDGCRRLGPNDEASFRLHTPGRGPLDTRATRLGVRGASLRGTRISITPGADGQPFAGQLQASLERGGGWQLATIWFSPARAHARFEVRVLAGPDGALLCHLWWLNGE